MRTTRAFAAAAMAMLVGAAAPTGFWHTGVTRSGMPYAVAYDEDPSRPMIRFECAGGEFQGTLYGATGLEDPETGRKIGDGPGASITGAAAQMNLVTDSASSKFTRAEAKPNRLGGWDMTIRLPTDNPAFLAFPKAEMIGFFTTGGGSISAVEKEDRKRLAEFVGLCRAGKP